MSLPHIPLFPLNAHVFPQGKLKLRIFEPRYMRMVKEAAGHTPAFAMGMMSQDKASGEDKVLNTATLVNLVDFELLDDGLLGITVEGTHLIKVDNIRQDPDGLRHADYQIMPGWQELSATHPGELKSKLRFLLQEYNEIGSLYPDPEKFPLEWYAARWLELLPIDSEIKSDLLNQPSADMAIEVIQAILKKNDPL